MNTGTLRLALSLPWKLLSQAARPGQHTPTPATTAAPLRPTMPLGGAVYSGVHLLSPAIVDDIRVRNGIATTKLGVDLLSPFLVCARSLYICLFDGGSKYVLGKTTLVERERER